MSAIFQWVSVIFLPLICWLCRCSFITDWSWWLLLYHKQRKMWFFSADLSATKHLLSLLIKQTHLFHKSVLHIYNLWFHRSHASLLSKYYTPFESWVNYLWEIKIYTTVNPHAHNYQLYDYILYMKVLIPCIGQYFNYQLIYQILAFSFLASNIGIGSENPILIGLNLIYSLKITLSISVRIHRNTENESN